MTKLVFFSFVLKEQAQRNSKNWIAGTLETKPILSVAKEVYRRCLIEKVLLAIHSKWPRENGTEIFIQQDNAKPHINPIDSKFVETASMDGFDIHLVF